MKPRLLGHWGTTPGLNFVYAHLNRIIRNWDSSDLRVGPGHGGPAAVANAYLEGTYSEFYPEVAQDADGLRRLFRQFSFPGGIPSHVAPETPGSIHEGGELGYSLAHAYGAAFDNPDLLVCCVVGDGEAETGPLATSWHSNKFLNPARTVPSFRSSISTATRSPTRRSGADRRRGTAVAARGVRPHLHLVEGDDPDAMHQRMAHMLDKIFDEIAAIQREARDEGHTKRPRWPMIVLRTPKGWTGPKRSTGLRSRARGARTRCRSPQHARTRASRAARDVDEELPARRALRRKRHARARARCACRRGYRRMSANPHANGGMLLRPRAPGLSRLRGRRDGARERRSESTRVLGGFLRDVMRMNGAQFRLFGPDETASNRLDALFEVTGRAGSPRRCRRTTTSRPTDASWRCCPSISARAGSRVPAHRTTRALQLLRGVHPHHRLDVQPAREMAQGDTRIPWRRPIASLNYLLSSHVWRQDNNGFSHQDPGFIDHVVNKKAEIIRVYLPPTRTRCSRSRIIACAAATTST